VGLGFRCAKAAAPEIEQRIRDAYISALVEMGRERLPEAQQAVDRGLAVDPRNVELLELRPLIEAGDEKVVRQSHAVLGNGVIMTEAYR
jgi:hypothetical protein